MADLEADFELLPREPLEATFEINVAEKGDKGDTGNGIESIEKTSTQGLVDTYTIQYTDGDSTTFDVTNGKDGTDGADGKDATINGVNTLTLKTTYGISLSQDGNTATLSGKEITDAVDRIDSLIPAQATEQNQLADKNFVNSSIATNTANFIGTFDSVEELEAYSGTLTNNDYAFVVGTDAAGNTVYDRYKYTTATDPASWQFEYELNNSSFTADQWAAINSKATESKINQIETNKTAIGTLSSLTTTDKSNLVGAVNELNSKKLDKVTTSTGFAQAYTKNDNGTQEMMNIVAGASSAYSIVARTGTGTISTATPTNDGEATNKSYVDTALSELDSKKIDKGYAVNDFETNCITEIPQDIKLELNNGTLTLKSGSVITYANGSQYQVTSDNTASGTSQSDGEFMVFSRSSDGAINIFKTDVCVSGTTDPMAGSSTQHMWFDTSSSKVYRVYADGTTSERSFPYAIITVSSGVITSIDQVFNGFGYIGKSHFVLPGVKVLAPDGRNADGTLKSTQYTLSSLIIQTSSLTNTSYPLVTQGNTGCYAYNVTYDKELNYNTINGSPSLTRCIVGTITYGSSGIDNLNINPVSGLSKNYISNSLTGVSGYDATKTQTLKHDANGALTWVTD